MRRIVTTTQLQRSSQAASPADSRAPAVRRNAGARQDIAWSGVFTLVLWTGCVTIGALGFVLPYTRPQPPAKQPEPVQAEILNVELSNDPLPPLDSASSVAPALSQPPPLPEPVAAPAAPPMIAVAQPSPAIAFALPVDGPVRVVEAKHAAHVAPPAETRTTPVVAAPVQQLVHGQGEGRQPAPTYPPQALRAGQEGTVRVRFSVGENGRVAAAEAVEPCAWGLLNSAAVRVIRERWRFPVGHFRLYEVAIHFQIPK